MGVCVLQDQPLASWCLPARVEGGHSLLVPLPREVGKMCRGGARLRGGAAHEGSSPHAGGHRVPSRRPGWDATGVPEQSRSLGGPQPSRRRRLGRGRGRREGRSEDLHETTSSFPPVLPVPPLLRLQGQLRGRVPALTLGGRGQAPWGGGPAGGGPALPAGDPLPGHQTLHFLPPNKAGAREGTGEARVGRVSEARTSRRAFQREALRIQGWCLWVS